MTRGAMFVIGFGSGVAVGATIATVAVAKHYKKKFEQWQADYVSTRVEIERRHQLREQVEKKAEKEPQKADIRKEPSEEKASPAATYERAAARYSGEDEESDSDSDDEDDVETDWGTANGIIKSDDKEAQYHGTDTGPRMTRDDISEALRLVDEERVPLVKVARRYDISKQALQLLIDDLRAERASGRKRPPKYGTPYTITYDEFEEERLEYEKVDLEYYRGDNTIFYSDAYGDDEPKQLIEVGKLLGAKKNLYQDKEDEDGRIYIRNDGERQDFRIVCYDESSSD